MPEGAEYLHATQVVVDRAGLRCRALDVDGVVRERFDWPFPAGSAEKWPTVDAIRLPPEQRDIVLLRIRGKVPQSHVWLSSRDGEFRVGVDVGTRTVAVELALPGQGVRRWRGPAIDFADPAPLQLAFHPGMGPGGILWRWTDKDAWSSMESASASGLEAFRWPAEIEPNGADLEVRCELKKPI
jgi:hypothetical protein